MKSMIFGKKALVGARQAYLAPEVEVSLLDSEACLMTASGGDPGDDVDYNDLGDI